MWTFYAMLSLKTMTCYKYVINGDVRSDHSGWVNKWTDRAKNGDASGMHARDVRGIRG